MTDSDSDTSNKVFTFQNDNATVNAKGLNINISNLSFRNPASAMFMSQNFERQRYAESTYDQRSMYYRRETSPMSIHSACDLRPRNFQQYPGMGSRQSVFNGRSGSPMSIRSIDSSASVCAADIAFAFKNVKFNRYDLKIIKDGYHKLMKQRFRKRIEKRRNMRLFLKSSRRRSGDDSGELGSDSSVSSGDCGSIKTYKENMSSSRSAQMDMTDFRKKLRDRNMLKGSDNFGQNTLKNKFTVGSSSVNNTQNFNNTVISNRINLIGTQRDRFRNGVLLPSQRFNRSVASSVIMEGSEKPYKSTGNNQLNYVRNHYAQNNHNKNSSGSEEEEEIFSEIPVREKSTFDIEAQCKRSLDSEDESSLPVRKKSRIMSPIKNAPNNKRVPSKLKNINPSNNNVELSNSFEFAKPSLPVRKSKPRVQEKLIAKSAQPLIDFMEPIPNKIQENVQVLQPYNLQEKSSKNLPQLDQLETTQNSDVSSRPSFIKRKLFTQKLDVAEKANLSSDETNSPQNSVYSLQKEKNKARKLVTNQSCLNREVQDDNNLLDLIHKIVPANHMNLTSQSTMNHTKSDVNNKNKQDNEDKWDVTSVISMCNEDDVSDTYTDEEIFEADNTTKHINKNKDINTKANPIDKIVNKVLIHQDCQVNLKKFPTNHNLQKQVVKQNFNLTHNNVTKNNVKSSGKTFWDTDLESDAECQTVLPQCHVMDNLKKANATLDPTKQDFKNPIGYARSEIFKKSLQIPEAPKHLNNSSINNTIMNNTFNSIRKCNTSTLSVRSHRTSKKKICCNETCAKETKSKLDNQNKISVDEKKDNSNEPVEKNFEKMILKDNLQNKNSTDMPKAKANTQNEKNINIARSLSQNKKSPKEKKAIKDKQVINPNNNTKKSETKSKSEKTSSVNNKKLNPETLKNKSAVHNKADKLNVAKCTQVKNNPKSKTQTDSQKFKNDAQKSPKNKPKSKSDRQNNSLQSKKNNPVLHSTNSNLITTEETIQNTSVRSGRPLRSCRTPSQGRSIEFSGSANLNNTSSVRSGRPLRSCRTPSQGRSIELSGSANLNNTSSVRSGRPLRSCRTGRTPSQGRSIELSGSANLNNTSVDINHRSLRSRVINLSSSIENITFDIKPKNKITNNKNISQMNTRKSDVSFSLGSNTPIPKIILERSRVDFFKGKRKT